MKLAEEEVILMKANVMTICSNINVLQFIAYTIQAILCVCIFIALAGGCMFIITMALKVFIDK